jgi:hypothetical protein
MAPVGRCMGNIETLKNKAVIQHSPVGCVTMRHGSLLCDTHCLTAYVICEGMEMERTSLSQVDIR